MAESTYTETAVLLAQLEGDRSGRDALLADMLPGELDTFEDHLRELADRVRREATHR